MRGSGAASRFATIVALIVGAVGGLSSIAAADADLAATIDLAIDAVDDRRFDADHLAVPVIPESTMDVETDWSLSEAAPSAVRFDLEPSAEPIVTQWRLPDPTSDSLVVVPLPAPIWSGLGGLALVSVLGMRGRNGRANGR